MTETSTPKQQGIVTFWLPAEEKAKLEELAATEERTVSAMMRLLVRQLLEERAS